MRWPTPRSSGCSSVREGETETPAAPAARPGQRSPAEAGPLLAVRGLAGGHGALQVLWDIDLDVAAGSVVVVLGANGAGKTTLLTTVAGHLPALAGQVFLDGVDVSRVGPAARARLGLAWMSEQAVFPELSVRENLRLGAWRLGRRAAREAVTDVLEHFPELAGRLGAPAGTLSGGQRKLLGLGKALAGRPRVLVLDEPSAGLSPAYVNEVVERLRALRSDGYAVLLAEQNVAFLALADRVAVLEGGRVRFRGTPADLEGDRDLAAAFFGITGSAPPDGG